jgi:hypothetical protein
MRCQVRLTEVLLPVGVLLTALGLSQRLMGCACHRVGRAFLAFPGNLPEDQQLVLKEGSLSIGSN